MARLTPNSNIVETGVGQETVLLHLTDGTYFGLDEVGTWIWTQIKSGASEEQIRTALVAEFDASESEASTDLANFIKSLRSHNILATDAGLG